jgi:outer membrane protein TolC
MSSVTSLPLRGGPRTESRQHWSSNRTPRVAGFVVAATIASVGGCRAYEAAPLDLPAHSDAWRARAPSDEPVRQFAERLAQADGESPIEFDPSDGLSLSEAELVALVYNPDLRLSRLRAGVAAATAEHAGLWDDPEFAIDVLRITESVSNPWVITPGLAITIPISGRLEAEKSRADAAMRAELFRIVEDEWRVCRDLAVAWSEWSAARLRLDEQQRLINSIGSMVSTADRLAGVGEIPRTEATLFAIERAQREYQKRRLTGEVDEAEQRVRAILGLSPAAPLAFIPTLDLAREFGGIESPGDHPALVRLREEYEVAEQTLRREIRKQYPDLTIGPLYESDEGQSKIGFLGAIPMPILNANRQGIAEAEALRQVARAAFETEYERLMGAIAAANARARALRDERAHIVDEIVPLIDQQLVDARRLLELGEGGSLVLLESIVRAHETKMHLIDVRLDEARSNAVLRYLTDAPTPLPEPIASPSATEAVEEHVQ